MKKILLLLTAAFMLPAFAGDFPPGSPKFGTNYDAALATAKKEGKPLILVFSAAWCPPCQSMKKSVYPSAEVKPLHDQFVWAYLDVDDSANAKAAEKYGVSGIPHIQFLSSTGKNIDKLVGGVPSEEFAKIISEVAKKAK